MTTNYVNNWCSNAVGAEHGFFKAVVHAFESFNQGDTNALGKLMCVTHGKTCKRIRRKEAERLPYATHLKRIMSKGMEGVEYKFDKSKDFGVVFTKSDNAGVNTDVIETLKMLGSKTVRDKAYKEAFPVESKAKEFDPEAWAERMKKAHPGKLDAMIAALQAQR